MKRLWLPVLFLLLVLSACNNEEPTQESNASSDEEEKVTEEPETNSEVVDVDTEVEEVEEVAEPTPQEQMTSDLVTLIDEGEAFDVGSYVKGDIPKGEYAFVTFEGSGQYYSEEDSAGNIIDNENFDSFGYVSVHEAGNIENSGALVKVKALDELEVSGSKELYEILNDTEDYTESGWYKIGTDLDPGEYIIESMGQGYVAVVDGPVGNNEIIKNDNFNGRYSVNVKEGQYLNISRGKISN